MIVKRSGVPFGAGPFVSSLAQVCDADASGTCLARSNNRFFRMANYASPSGGVYPGKIALSN
jgi:hypothetical protein